MSTPEKNGSDVTVDYSLVPGYKRRSACDTCETCKGELVCDICGVPDCWATFPKDMFTTLMSAHNRIRMTCNKCIQELRKKHG